MTRLHGQTTPVPEQSMSTIVIPFPRDRVEAVDKSLKDSIPLLRKGGEIRDVLRGTRVHFLTITVVRGDGNEPTHLVFEVNADGPAGHVPDLLAGKLEPWIGPLLDTAGVPWTKPLGSFLAGHAIRTGTGLFSVPGVEFCGTPGMTVERIVAERRLSEGIRDHLDKNPPSSEGALETLRRVREHVRGVPELARMLEPEAYAFPRLGASRKETFDLGLVVGLVRDGIFHFTWPLLALFGVILLGASVAAWAAAGAAVGILVFVVGTIVAVIVLVAYLWRLYAGLRRMEEENSPDDTLPNQDILDEVMKHENWSQQNHLAGVSIMQAGRLRELTLRVAFWVILQMVLRKYRKGFLGDLNTIHFARWVRLPKTNKLLFFSNYGGSWESYLEDFITRASSGLTAVWSNTQGFPRARNLFQDGATDGDRFKRWARRQQRPTYFWYSAYPNLTTARIRTNATIRQGLSNASTIDEAAAWLALIGSRVRPDDQIETAEVQTLLFGGLSKHPHSACLAIKLPSSVKASREWLRDMLPQITFGDEPPEDLVVVLAITNEGLGRLGLADDVRGQFPTAFRQGMAHPTRTNILADTGDDKPEDWLWGSSEASADATLLIYANDEKRLEVACLDLEKQLADRGGKRVYRVSLASLPPRAPGQTGIQLGKEAFGFVDGVSQPIIKGTRRWMREADAIHSVAPGEFLLGYPDSRGFFPHSPNVPAEADRSDRLPLASQAHSRGAFQADFGQSRKSEPRDFGRNGTFLVIRQLEQDVEAFRSYVADAAAKCVGHPAVPAAIDTPLLREEWIRAKLVGRWSNGTSLVRFPHRPGSPKARPDNEFLYGAEDPLGERCPLGAHIRRSNPRDSKAPGSKEEIDIVNRHRILRVGRGYDAAGSGAANEARPGLLFMCLNADIERQFEFIQQTWAMSWQFHGLENEVDPILGRGVGSDGGERRLARLTVPSPNGPLHLTGLRDFVRMRGGGYFFLPSRRAVAFLAESAD